jgi:hypothetical protein
MLNLGYASRYAYLAQITRERYRRAGRCPLGALWEEWEVELFRSHYPDHGTLGRLLPHRSRRAIDSRADKLGIRSKHFCWTGARHALLRKMFATASFAEMQAAFPGATVFAIQGQARRLGLQRASWKALKPTGHPLVDAVRERARSFGFAMTELDAEAGSKRYFCGGCHQHPPNYQWIARAIELLDGQIRIEWQD